MLDSSMSISVYYPYYNTYGYLDTSRNVLKLCLGIQKTMGGSGIVRNQVINPSKNKTAGH